VDASASGLLNRLLATLFPPRCLGCGLRGTDLCSECWAGVPWLDTEVCPYCARRSRLARICGRCQRDGPALDGVRAACRFDGLVRSAVHDLKYRRVKARADVVAALVLEGLARRPLAVDLLVPVPLAAGRMRQRGFNQSALVAEHVGRVLGVPVLADGLLRTRETTPQVGKSAEQRSANIADAVACRFPEMVQGKRVGVVDDVMTTGATLAACADALRAAGAARVYGIVAAHEV
jgi:ComF family protein